MITNKCRAFTLIEVLVVLVIIGIIATVASLALGNLQLRSEVLPFIDDVVRMLKLAQQTAIFAQTELGVTVHSDDIQFYRFDGVSQTWYVWQPFSLVHQSHLPRNLRVNLHIKNLGDVSLSSNSINDKAPQIIISPGGEMTPFTLTFQFGADNYVIEANYSGEITLH